MLLLGVMTNNFSPVAQAESSPLEVELTDTPLSTTTRQKLVAKIDKLEQQAQTSLENQNSNRAFKLWYEALRLQQQLQSPLTEVQQLAQVGAVAWQQNRTEDLKIITERLKVIESSSPLEQTSTDLLSALADAYVEIRSIDRALSIYEAILAQTHSSGDRTEQVNALNTMGSLHLSRFDYRAAAPMYEELLSISASESEEIAYLQTLIKIYDRSFQPEPAVALKQQLFQYYQRTEQMKLLPALQLAIASDYEALEQVESANLAYQTAFELAWSQQQLAVAAEALTKLADLHERYEQYDHALEVYLELTKVQQRTYDHYGLMFTYDRMAQIHRQQRNYRQAMYVLEQALEIAKSLNYRQPYFTEQIQRLR